MRILVVHEVNYLSKTIYEFQILPEILSLLGHSVSIIDYNDSWKNEHNQPNHRNHQASDLNRVQSFALAKSPENHRCLDGAEQK